MSRIRLFALSLCVLPCLYAVALASSASVRFAESPIGHHFYLYDNLCVYNLPPCAREGTCEAFGAIARSPRHGRNSVFQVRMGHKGGTPAPPPGAWQVWGYFRDAFGHITETAVWATTIFPCVEVVIEPIRPPGGQQGTAPGILTVEVYEPAEKPRRSLLHLDHYVVPGMVGQRFRRYEPWRYFPIVRLSAWADGPDTTQQFDVRARASGTVTEQGIRKFGLGVCLIEKWTYFAPPAFCP